MSRETTASPFEAEVTPIGVQTLVAGVAPITPAERLAMRANAPMEPKKPQRPADHVTGTGDALGEHPSGALFDTNARLQIEMFP
ncbi:MAG TPA: hypothetical protein PKC46_05915 [Sphingorhabdus sp.]|nr:hypothetical protein [Sphingorhabdus sp.]